MPVYTLSGVEVEFPYDAYPCQLDYMTKVVQALQQGQHALLESPTGTGKTLCLLCATLAWRKSLVVQAAAHVGNVQQNPHSSSLVQGLREAWAEHRATQMEAGAPGSGLPQIIYSSRTHSQLQQVMRELRKLSYKPRAATVASRQHGCLHPTVSTMGAGANQACRALTAKRACKWYNGVEKFMRQNPEANAEVLDIEDLARIGESRAVCPYFLARSMASTADIVFMPYNYLIDWKTRAGLNIQWQNSVLIFDEAHNVEQVCSDSMSFDLPAAVLAGAIEELGTAAELAASARGSTAVNVYNELGGQDRAPSMAVVSSELHRARAVLCRLEQEIAKLQLHPDNGLTRPGAFLFELLGSCGINMDTWQVLYDCLETAMSQLTEEAVSMGRKTGSRASSYSLHRVAEGLRLAFVGTAGESAPEPEPLKSTGGQWPPPRAVLAHNAAKPLPPSHAAYRVHVHMEKSKSGRVAPTLSYWCFSPALSMRALTDMQVRSILLTSGTLSPLDSFAGELGLDFPVRLENPHVISKEQVWVGVVPSGPSGHSLNSSYQNRDNAQYRLDLGMALVNFARIIPDGLLVFFPSYALLQSCITTWKQVTPTGGPSIWERIARSKQPVVEPRESGAFQAAAEDFRAKLANPAYNGAVFFAVTRGKASEGLDFSDAAGRAVVLTGIPYPMKMDPKVRLKQESLNEARAAAASRKRPAGGSGGAAGPGLSGDQWYSQSALRAVNQAVGRVIRHRRDYGAIILADERFRQPGVQRQLSCWLRDQVHVFQNYGAANGSLVQFFKQQAEAARKGLVDGGGQAVVPGAARAAGAAGARPAPGPFQSVATGGGGGGGRTLMQQAPTAIDAVGMTELFAPMAAAAAVAAAAPVAQQAQLVQQQAQQVPNSGSQRHHLQLSYEQSLTGSAEAASGGGQAAGASRLMSALGGGGSGGAAAPARLVSGPTAAATAAVNSLLSELEAAGPALQQGAGCAPAGQPAAPGRPSSGRMFEPRPWERAALAASARPCPPRAPVAPAAAAAAGNVVGPAHLVAQHAERQRQRSASVEPEHAEQAQQGQRQVVASDAVAAEQREQRGALLPGDTGDQQQQQDAPPEGGAGGGGKAEQRAETVQTFLTRLRAELPKEHFDVVRAELRAYSQGRDLPRLLAAAAPLLQPHPALLQAFAGFIPKAARPALEQQLQQLREPTPATPQVEQQPQQQQPQQQQPQQQQRPQQQPQQLQKQQQRPAPASVPGMQHQAPGMLHRQHQQHQQHQQQAPVAQQQRQQVQQQQQWAQHQQPAQQRPAQQQQPTRALPAAGQRQPLAQQQAQQQRAAQQQQQQQQPKKLQQLAMGDLPSRQRPGSAGMGPQGATMQQMLRQRAAAAGPAAGMLMPPRGMQQAAVQRAGPSHAAAAGAIQLPGSAQLPRPTGGGAAGRPAARGPPCPVCHKAPMDAPHAAGCGHTACYACWLKALAVFKCPVCSRGVRKAQLQKKYFA